MKLVRVVTSDQPTFQITFDPFGHVGTMTWRPPEFSQYRSGPCRTGPNRSGPTRNSLILYATLILIQTRYSHIALQIRRRWTPAIVHDHESDSVASSEGLRVILCAVDDSQFPKLAPEPASSHKNNSRPLGWGLAARTASVRCETSAGDVQMPPGCRFHRHSIRCDAEVF